MAERIEADAAKAGTTAHPLQGGPGRRQPTQQGRGGYIEEETCVFFLPPGEHRGMRRNGVSAEVSALLAFIPYLISFLLLPFTLVNI